MVPAWRGEGGREGWRKGEGEGGDEERDSRSVTYSAVTYGDKSDVKLMIGDDGESKRKHRERLTGGTKLSDTAKDLPPS